MTKNQFDKLDRFNLKKFAKGDKVVVEFGGDIYFPTEQRYFPEHPDPIVVKINDMCLAYSVEYASKQMRMIPKERYQVRFQYPDESQKSMTWVVIDTKYGETMGSFGTKIKEGAVKAGSYARFLNEESEKLKQNLSKALPKLVEFSINSSVIEKLRLEGKQFNYLEICELMKFCRQDYGEKAKVQDQYY